MSRCSRRSLTGGRPAPSSCDTRQAATRGRRMSRSARNSSRCQSRISSAPRGIFAALRKPLDRLRRDWHFDAVLTASLLPGACAAARLAEEFQFRFVALSVRDDAEPRLRESGVRKIVAASLARAAGVVTDSSAISALLSETGFRKDRMTLISNQETAAESCHRLLLPVRG
jgi:hypothetical protein